MCFSNLKHLENRIPFNNVYIYCLISKYQINFSGKQEDVDTILEALKVMAEPFRSMATTIVDICAYAGTGNVLKVQQLLHICSEHYEAKDQVRLSVFTKK